jgi:hypothetical protein
MTGAEVQKLLGLARTTLQLRVKQGELVKVGRDLYNRATVERLLANPRKARERKPSTPNRPREEQIEPTSFADDPPEAPGAACACDPRCKKTRPALARKHRDPFASNKCAQKFYGVKLTSGAGEEKKAA